VIHSLETCGNSLYAEVSGSLTQSRKDAKTAKNCMWVALKRSRSPSMLAQIALWVVWRRLCVLAALRETAR